MRSAIALALALLLLVQVTLATGEETQTFSMVGCDTYHYTRNWSTNAFFPAKLP